MTEHKTPRTRRTSRFSWDEVDDDLLCELILAADDAPPTHHRRREVKLLPRQSRVDVARERFGSPPRLSWTATLVPVLVDKWLPTLPAAEIRELADICGVGLRPTRRPKGRSPKQQALKLLQERRKTRNFKSNIRSAFLARHKVSGVSTSNPSNSVAQGPYKLHGQDQAAAYEPYHHQREAWARLDELWATRPEFKALVVLPTGAGKTETAVEWVLDRLDAEPKLRVLWVSHQQELVVQAMARFQACVAHRPASMKFSGRAIHAGASPWSVLADPDLDIAAITVQSLTRGFDRAKRKAVKRFLARPMLLVIDEAHHVPSGDYQTLFEEILPLAGESPRATLGLTATPWPTSAWGQQQMIMRFPEEAYNANEEDLVRSGVLARPVFNTVETHQPAIVVSPTEAQQASRSDLPPSVLARLANAPRDAEVLEAYQGDADKWGKTLVFATGIRHADQLTAKFAQVVDTRVMHSQSGGDPSATLQWFREAKSNCVLVSVGMLTEGVDLPDAKTAFLVRPTASRVLLRQMIGRVLRGPKAGGGEIAHIVYFADHWTNFGEILRPEEVIQGDTESEWSPRGATSDLPVPFDVVGEMKRMFDIARLEPIGDPVAKGEAPPSASVSDPLIHESWMAGYYVLLDRRIPVLEHQEDGIKRLLDAAGRTKSKLPSLLSFFDEVHLPHPAHHDLRRLVEYVREFPTHPTFEELKVSIGPSVCADRIIAAGPLTEAQRRELVGQCFRNSLAPVAYPSEAHYEEAVERELRDRTRRRSPEREIPASGPRKPRVPRADRRLKPILDYVEEQAAQLLPADLLERLHDLPAIDWTKRVHSSSFATWSQRSRGYDRPIILVNRLLRAPSDDVPDGVLRFLVWHELLHHVLPGQGHDAEFRDLEASWPDSEHWNFVLDTFEERWSTKPADYPTEP